MSHEMPSQNVETNSEKKFEVGETVRWTEEAVARANSGRDRYDAALVIPGVTYTVVEVTDRDVTIRNDQGHTIPANPKSIEKV